MALPTQNERVGSPERGHTHQSKAVRCGDSEREQKTVREKRERGERGRKREGATDGKPITCATPEVWPAHPKSKPVTRPIPMSGNELETYNTSLIIHALSLIGQQTIYAYEISVQEL